MVIQDDAWRLIRKRRLTPDEIHEIAMHGLGIPEARWRYQETGVGLSDVQFYLELKRKELPPPQRIEIWGARRKLYGLPAPTELDSSRVRATYEPAGVVA